jgi:hypothetical protein
MSTALPRRSRPLPARLTLDTGLARLEPMALIELEAEAALLTRTDRKYVVPPATAIALVRALRGSAAVLEIGARRRFHYRSLYFDTDDRASYRGAAMGRRRRFKVRTRVYDDQSTCVLEVKTRGTRGETVKERLAYDHADRSRLTPEGRSFVDLATGRRGLGASLGPVMATSYVRSTVVDRRDGTRITLDRRLRCENLQGDARSLDDFVIVETKSRGAATQADRWLWQHGLRPVRLSKFCVGMALLDPRLPANRWHRVLQRYFAWSPGPPGRACSDLEQQGDRPVVHELDLHVRAEDAGGHVGPAGAERVGEGVHQRLGLLRPGRVDVGRSPSLARVAVERELADDEHRARHVGHRPVHDSLVIGEDAQLPELAGQLLGVRGVVVVGDAHEHAQAGADAAHHLAVDRHGRAGHPLDESAHDYPDGGGGQAASGSGSRLRSRPRVASR